MSNPRELLFFTGDHCKTCDAVKKKLSEKIPKVKITYVNVSNREDARVAAKYHIMSLPTVLLVEDTIPIKTFVGSTIISSLMSLGLV